MFIHGGRQEGKCRQAARTSERQAAAADTKHNRGWERKDDQRSSHGNGQQGDKGTA